MLAMRTITRAFGNLDKEVTERIDGTPLKAINLLSETAKDGTITVGFDYKDYWSGDVKGTVDILSKTKEREFALLADLSVYGERIDFEAYMNKERIAVGTKMLDNNYYGLTYKTFREDIRGFGNLIGLDKQTMDTLADMVDMISEAMNAKEGPANIVSVDKYTGMITSFVKKVEMTSEREKLESGGTSIRCTRTDFLVTSDSIIELLNDMLEALQDDEDFKNQYNSIVNNQLFSGTSGVVSYNELMREFRNAIREMERGFSGDVKLSLYIGKGNRLIRLEVHADVKVDSERVRVQATFDFGESATDRWVANMTVNAGSNKTTMRVVWDYRDRSNGIENTITISVDGDDQVVLRSLWSPKSGDFSLSYDDGWSEGEITGSFKENDKGFVLEIDNLSPGYNDYLSFSIKAQSGAQIRKIDYINLDKWGETLIGKLEDLMYGFY